MSQGDRQRVVIFETVEEPRKMKVLVVDDHALIREACEAS